MPNQSTHPSQSAYPSQLSTTTSPRLSLFDSPPPSSALSLSPLPYPPSLPLFHCIPHDRTSSHLSPRPFWQTARSTLSPPFASCPNPYLSIYPPIYLSTTPYRQFFFLSNPCLGVCPLNESPPRRCATSCDVHNHKTRDAYLPPVPTIVFLSHFFLPFSIHTSILLFLLPFLLSFFRIFSPPLFSPTFYCTQLLHYSLLPPPLTPPTGFLVTSRV